MKNILLVLLFITHTLSITTYAQSILLMPVDGLWYSWDGDDGILYDDGGTSDYTTNGSGKLTIYPLDQVNDKIVLRFLSFDVEFNSTCSWDVLKVYEGETMNTLLGTHCGNTVPNVYTSTDPNGSLTIFWDSDGSVVSSGFSIDISVVSPSTSVELGDPNSTTTDGRVPSYGYYDFSWSALIYESSEIGSPMIINELQFDVENDVSVLMQNQKIYIAHTTNVIFPNGGEPTNGITYTDWVLVYEGSITWEQGWNKITLTTPFIYDGVENLMIKTVNGDGSWVNNYPLFRYTAKTNSVVYNYDDGVPPNSSGYRNEYRPNMRFGFNVGSPLPVELTTFNCGWVGENVEIKWETASETNNDYYVVEHSRDGLMWDVINTTDGVGNSTQTTIYSTVHRDVPNGINYYRLTQVDFDGQQEMFDIISCLKNINNGDIERVDYYNLLGQLISTTNNPSEMNQQGLFLITTTYKNGDIRTEKVYKTCCQ